MAASIENYEDVFATYCEPEDNRPDVEDFAHVPHKVDEFAVREDHSIEIVWTNLEDKSQTRHYTSKFSSRDFNPADVIVGAVLVGGWYPKGTGVGYKLKPVSVGRKK